MEEAVPTVINRWIDRLSRLQVILPIALIGLAAAMVVYPRVSSSDAIERVISPDGRTVAEVDVTSGGGATEAAYIGVRLRSRFNPFRHYVFAGLDYGANVSVHWINADNLQIKCERCSNMDRRLQEVRWEGIAIHYEFE